MDKITVFNHEINRQHQSKVYSEAYAWFVWSLAALFYGYQFILRVSPGVMTDCLMQDFAIEACALGILSGCYYNSYTFLQVPIGLAMDRFGASRLLRASILLCAFGTLIFSIAPSLYVAATGRVLIGAGSACAFLGAIKLATNWFKPERLALIVGFTILTGKIGAILGQMPLAYLITIIGWRNSMLLMSGIGILLASAIWTFVTDTPPRGSITKNNVQETNFNTLLVRLRDIATNYRIWALAIYGAMMYVPLAAFADLWGIPYLMKLYGISREQAGFATSMIFIGAGVGSPLIAIISNYFEERRRIMIVGAVLSLVINGIIILIPELSFSLMMVMLFAIGFVFPAQSLIFSAVCRLTPHSSSGTVISFTNMIVMISGVVMQPLLGWLLDWVWDGALHNGVPFYTIEDYRFSLMSIPICLFIALIAMPFIPETYPKKQKYSSDGKFFNPQPTK